jgi:hypothetical protein
LIRKTCPSSLINYIINLSFVSCCSILKFIFVFVVIYLISSWCSSTLKRTSIISLSSLWSSNRSLFISFIYLLSIWLLNLGLITIWWRILSFIIWYVLYFFICSEFIISRTICYLSKCFLSIKFRVFHHFLFIICFHLCNSLCNWNL